LLAEDRRAETREARENRLDDQSEEDDEGCPVDYLDGSAVGEFLHQPAEHPGRNQCGDCRNALQDHDKRKGAPVRSEQHPEFAPNRGGACDRHPGGGTL
jgi:hypothetical protein